MAITNFEKCFVKPIGMIFPDSNGFAFIGKLGIPTNDYRDIKIVGNVKFVSTDFESINKIFIKGESLLSKKNIDKILELSKVAETRISDNDLNYMCCIEV